MTEPLIRLRDVSKRFVRGKETITIFEHLNLEIPPGDFVAIMGPSGSGKTTLLNLIGGIDRATSGEITFDGNRVDQLSEGQLANWRSTNVGFIFQFYNLMLLTNLGADERKRRVETALSVVQLPDRARHSPSELSGGQQQRVAIARAIVSDPLMLLCDEPTGDLDRHTADEILSMFQLLNRELEKTIVMVTHDPEAAKYAKRTLHLDKGHFTEKVMAA
jgi:putative ABC transport system ATP-binding protein